MSYPAQSPVLRRSLARRDICPECGGALDTGWECNACGYDAQHEAYSEIERARDKRLGAKEDRS